MNTPEERISYSVICDKQPDPCIYHSTYEEAVKWAKFDQPNYRHITLSSVLNISRYVE